MSATGSGTRWTRGRLSRGFFGRPRPRPAKENLCAAGYDDGFLLGVVVEHLSAVLFAVAAVLGATEGQLVVGNLDGVDPGVASLELVNGALCLEDRKSTRLNSSHA